MKSEGAQESVWDGERAGNWRAGPPDWGKSFLCAVQMSNIVQEMVCFHTFPLIRISRVGRWNNPELDSLFWLFNKGKNMLQLKY